MVEENTSVRRPRGWVRAGQSLEAVKETPRHCGPFYKKSRSKYVY